MNIEDIEKFLAKGFLQDEEYVQISFKEKRESIFGVFIREGDYGYLKSKNLWRIVPQTQVENYKKTKDSSLARIFNGASFSRLSSYTESFE